MSLTNIRSKDYAIIKAEERSEQDQRTMIVYKNSIDDTYTVTPLSSDPPPASVQVGYATAGIYQDTTH